MSCPLTDSFMKNFVVAVVLALFGLLVSVPFALADTSGTYSTITNPCQPIYGGGETCVQTGNILIDKKVSKSEVVDTKGGKSTNEVYVDNLEINDFKYTPGSTVKFKLTVKNTGNTVLTNVTIKDIFPQYVQFVSGDGKFDANTKTFTANIKKLNAGETKELLLTGKVAQAQDIPDSEGIICVVNQATISSDGNNSAEDTAQFCIQKQKMETKGGLKVAPSVSLKESPATGPELLGLAALLPSSLAGYILRRKSLKKS